MKFYQSIADHYEEIFPLNMVQLNFVRNSFNDTSKLTVLDIGCGTGALSIELGKIFNSVTAIDLDKGMLKKAKARESKNVQFRRMDMLTIEKEFGPKSFDAVICFGNTLVHLDGKDQLLDFFKQARKILKKEGKLLFQIINYDRIIDQNIKSLPTIENDNIRFARNYNLDPGQKALEFHTILTTKKTGQTIENKIQLYPVRSGEINHLLLEAGFSEIFFFSNFNKKPFSGDCIPLVVEAR
jgi:SAM-dependent methyltransferase